MKLKHVGRRVRVKKRAARAYRKTYGADLNGLVGKIDAILYGGGCALVAFPGVPRPIAFGWWELKLCKEESHV